MVPRNAAVTPASRSVTVDVTTRDKRHETRDEKGKDPVSSAEETLGASGTPRKARTPGPGYVILKAVVDALDKRGIPRPDEKLKTIVGAQIAALLRGGYPADQIRHFAVELALSWDNAKGHQRLLGLRQAVLQDDADREYKAHGDRKLAAARDVIPADPAVAIAMLNAAKRRLGHSGGRVAWTAGCSSDGCSRTALYATATCVEHATMPTLPAVPTEGKTWESDNAPLQVKTT